jgi:kelch-like protein 17 (actinfilin)
LRRRLLPGLIALATVALVVALTAPPTPTEHNPAAATASAAVSGWREDSTLRIARRALAVASDGRFIYAVGGMDGNERYVAATEYAAIRPDGSLSAWQLTTPLATPRFYLGAAALDGYLYAIGGAVGPRGDANQPVATVERAKIFADGSLGSWEAQANLTTPRRGLKVVTLNGRLYGLGGYNGVFLKTSERSEVDANGNLAAWHEEAAVAVVDRYIHAAATLKGQIYLLGGHVQGAAALGYGNVERSGVDVAGNLLRWELEASALRTPRFMATAAGLGEHLYVIGGHDGAQQLASVEFATLLGGGHLGPWQTTTAMPTPRSAAAVVAVSSWLYVIGGAQGDQPIARVARARPDRRGRLGPN